MGGLSAAACLAKAGKKVLVIERHNVAGGYAHGFKRGKDFFDSAAHATSTCEPVPFGDPSIIDWLLRALGVRDRCTFLPLDPFYRTCFPGFRMDAPAGIDAFVEAHAEHFPEERQGLRHILRLFTRINREYKSLPSDISSYEALHSPEKFPILNQYKDATLAQVMDEFLKDPRLKAVFSTLWGYQGLPPSRMGDQLEHHADELHPHGGVLRPGRDAEPCQRRGLRAWKSMAQLLLRSEYAGLWWRRAARRASFWRTGPASARQSSSPTSMRCRPSKRLVGVEHLPADFVRISAS